MEQGSIKPTKFDSMVTTRNLQLAKVVVPYLNNETASMLGMYIKFRELQNAANIMRKKPLSAMNTDKPDSAMNQMFEDIKDMLDEDERDTIDMIMTLMEMMNMDNSSMEDIMGNFMNMNMFNE